MKNFIKNTSLFVVFAGIFYIIVLPIWSYILPPFMAKNVRSCVGCYGYLFSRVKDIEHVKNPDILFLGSSHAYRGLDPRIFKEYGISSFNLGSSAQTPINTKVLLHQYLDKIKPKMVVYEVYVGTLSADGIGSSLDILSNNKIDIHSLRMAFDVNKVQTYNTLLYGVFRQVLGLNKNFKEDLVQAPSTYISGTGYVETVFNENQFSEKLQKEKWTIRDKQISVLKENIEFIKSKNIPVVLVQAPITSHLYSLRTNNKEADSILYNLAPYKNFYGEIPLNDTIDFYDSHHLNQQGVVKFNHQLIKWLQTIKK